MARVEREDVGSLYLRGETDTGHDTGGTWLCRHGRSLGCPGRKILQARKCEVAVHGGLLLRTESRVSNRHPEALDIALGLNLIYRY